MASSRSRRRIRWAPLLLFGAYLIYYYFSHQEEVPITGRTQLVDMSREQEAALGASSYRQILGKERVISQGAEVDQVRRIGARIAAVSDDPGFSWEFNVVRSPQANAFALPGGKVAVYTGLLPVTMSEDGLAVVMGHEIAHAIARHGAERMAQQKLTNLGKLSVGMAVREMDTKTQLAVMGALGVGAKFGVLLPFSRKHESEADYMGLIYLAKACYDPREAPKVWLRMGQKSAGQASSSSKTREFMSTHPSHETRIAQFKKWMPEALAVRKTHCPNKPLR